MAKSKEPTFNFGANAKPRTPKPGSKAARRKAAKGKKSNAWSRYTGGRPGEAPF